MEDSLSSSQEPPPPNSPPRHTRTRARSNSIRGENPLETPLTAEEHNLSRLGSSFNRSRESVLRTINTVVTSASYEEQRLRARQKAQLFESGGYRGTIYTGRSSGPRSSSNQSGSLAPRADPVDRSKTPTQEQFSRQQLQLAADLLPRNPCFGESASSNPRAPLFGPRPQPSSSSRDRAVSQSSGSQLPLPIPHRVRDPRPPIPVVERPANLPSQPATHLSGPQTSDASRSALFHRSSRSQDFPVRGLSNSKINPTRRTTQLSTPIERRLSNNARVEIWDPRLHQESSTSLEAFPAFEEYSPAPSFCGGSSSSGFSSDGISAIGRLVARDRGTRTRSGSCSSNDSVVTVIHIGKTDLDKPSDTNQASPSAGSSQTLEGLEHLKNPRVFSVQLPINYFILLENLRAAHFQEQHSGHYSEVANPALQDQYNFSSPSEQEIGPSPDFRPRFGAESRNDHRSNFIAAKRTHSRSLESSSSELFRKFCSRSLPELTQAERRLDLYLEKSYHNNDLEHRSSFIHSEEAKKERIRAQLHERVVFERCNSSVPPIPVPKRSFSVSDYSPSSNMSFQNYADQPSGGVGVNPRQAPPSPSQGAPHTNGMNGGMVGGMVGYPTPAGHQSDLNYLMTLVEDLSGVLAHNQRLTNGVVEKMGRVREKAKNLDLSNDELLQLAASELNDSSRNLERENTELRAALEKSDYDKKENFKLACHGANILADITEKMHAFKEQHEADTLAWHKNYRKQLAEEREENLRIRNEINDKIATAVRANGHLRDMRRYITDHDELNELKIQNTKLRQERRWWKRMALPMIPDDDSEWSDDDDLIDPEEKKRVAAALVEKKAREQEDIEGGEASAA